MTDRDIALHCLRGLAPHRAEDYDAWLRVGMALKSAGCSVADWDAWSRASAKYRPGVCEAKWRSFNGAAQEVTVATLVQWLHEDGGRLPEGAPAQHKGYPLAWDSPIGGERFRAGASGSATAARANGSATTAGPIAAADYVEALPPPGSDPAQDLLRYLEALFRPEERVSYVVESFKDADGHAKPAGKGVFTRTAGELGERVRKFGTDLGSAIGDWDREAGAWVRINPVDGQGVTNDNVTDCRHVLVESDGMPLEKQFALIRELRLPCAATVHSGGKSIHAVVRVDAGPDRKLYRERVDYLFRVLAQNGFEVDRQCRNPARLSRLPGISRGAARQYLIAVNEGLPTWNAWETWSKEERYSYTELTVQDLETADPVKESDALLGSRFLCRDGSWLIVAQSGVGKSTLCLQGAMHFAVGRDLWGLAPTGPLRQVIIQAENNRLDLVEPFKSIRDRMALDDAERQALRRNLVILSEDTQAGPRFCPFLDHVIQKYAPQVVWIDPLLAYIGDEIGKQAVCSTFLRNQLNPILHRHRVGVIIMHHTPKPPKGEERRQRGHDLAYLGAGSSELTNWARAVSVVTEDEDGKGVYVFEHVKRGNRTGTERRVSIRHAATGIYWEFAGQATPRAGQDNVSTSKSKYWHMGLEHLPPCRHDVESGKSELLAAIIRLRAEAGEMLDLKQAESIRKCAANLGCKGQTSPLVYDRATGLWRGLYWFETPARDGGAA